MKEHRGRKADIALKQEIRDLRDKKELSFVDIARITGLKSRQVARYHYLSYTHSGEKKEFDK